MSKLAIIGDKTSVLGFKAIGFDIYPIVDIRKAPSIWQEVLKRDYAAIFITAHVYREIRDLVEEIKNKVTPAVVIITPKGEEDTLAKEEIDQLIRKAVGTGILLEREEKK